MTGESQEHGNIMEKIFQKEIFLMSDEDISSYGQTAIHDISSKHTQNSQFCSGMDVSIKTSGCKSIDCGDVIRFIESSDNTKLICVFYKQESDYKTASKTISFDIRELIDILLPEDKEDWKQKVKEYVSYVKSIPPGECDQSLYPYKKKKESLCLKHFNIAPKVDSKSQRRVQCSINMKAIEGLPSYEEFEGGKFHDKEFTKKIYSPPRSRNGMTINKLKDLAKENNINGPGKRGGWSGLKKKDMIHYLEEKGLSIPQ